MLLPLLLPLLASVGAHAQPVSAVPPGATAVTVMLCARADACAPEWTALAAHMTAARLPLLDFDTVAVEGPAGKAELDRFEAAMAPIRRGEPSPGALAMLDGVPFTVTRDDLFRLMLLSGHLDRAASVSDRRVYDLPPMPDVAAYLDVAARPAEARATLEVSADAPGARILVDGEAVGEAPRSVAVSAGWHRVTVERTGRRTAWVGRIDAPPGGTLRIAARVADDDGRAGLEAAVIGARHGTDASGAALATLSEWAVANGLRWVRFVELGSGPDAPEERIPGDHEVRAVYLDVPARRFTTAGPGPAALRVAADPERFRLGVSVGYLRLGPRDHVAIDIATLFRLRPALSLDLRVGLAHSAQDYYLYEDWIDRQVYPLAVGARLGRASGPWVTAAALAVIPYALGGEVKAGWDFAPSPTWRITPEARVGGTDKGWLGGAGLTVTRRR